MTVQDALGFAFSLFVVWQVVWGLVAFVTMWRDKRLAQERRTRIPEAQLHHLEAWGGWLGSGLAQVTLRHKTRKKIYQRVFRRSASLWLIAWLVLGILQAL
nr:DUF1294 domain-containing protein [Deinococcus arboris]